MLLIGHPRNALRCPNEMLPRASRFGACWLLRAAVSNATTCRVLRKTTDAFRSRVMRLSARDDTRGAGHRESCLNRMILFGEGSLRRTVHEFVAHYHYERNHQGRDNQLLFPEPAATRRIGAIACRERLGGRLKYYHRPAA